MCAAVTKYSPSTVQPNLKSSQSPGVPGRLHHYSTSPLATGLEPRFSALPLSGPPASSAHHNATDMSFCSSVQFLYQPWELAARLSWYQLCICPVLQLQSSSSEQLVSAPFCASVALFLQCEPYIYKDLHLMWEQHTQQTTTGRQGCTEHLPELRRDKRPFSLP